jgi:hypothetical protein
MLLIFIRRLTRRVEGYTRPACGWCSDTGVEYQVQRPDYWPVSCHACQPEAHQHQTGFRQAARARRERGEVMAEVTAGQWYSRPGGAEVRVDYITTKGEVCCVAWLPGQKLGNPTRRPLRQFLEVVEREGLSLGRSS